MLYSIVGILIIILDQAVKLYVTKMAASGEAVKTLIPGVVSLVRVQNDGAAFSFLAGGGARIWFIVLTLIFVLLVILALATNFISGKFGRWCMVIVAAGGLANCIDRVLYGYVLDMFRIDLFNFAVFNVADIFITVGCIAFILYILFGGEKESSPDDDEYDEIDDEDYDKPKREPVFKNKKPRYADDDDIDEDEDDTVPVVKKSSTFSKLKPSSVNQFNPSERVSTQTRKPHPQTDADRYASHSSKKSAEDEAKAFEEFFKKRAESKQPASSQVKRDVSTQRSIPVTIERDSDSVVSEVRQVKAVEPPKPITTVANSSDDFNLDDILNEFK